MSKAFTRESDEDGLAELQERNVSSYPNLVTPEGLAVIDGEIDRRALGTELLIKGRLPPRVREVVILRVAWRTGSVYEWGQHVRIGRDSGLDDDEITSLATEAAAVDWSEAERLAVTVTDELCSGDDLTDATWSAAAAEWGEEDLIELILLVGNYRMLAGFLNAARVEPDPGLDGFPP